MEQKNLNEPKTSKSLTLISTFVISRLETDVKRSPVEVGERFR